MKKDPAFLTKFLKIMLCVSAAFIVLSIISDFMQLNLLNDQYFNKAEADANDARQQILGLLFLGAYIITGITFLKWIYRANSNCRGFGAQNMKFTPGWSIGYYFIPILCIFRPYKAMKEIWMASKNPDDWQNQKGGALLGWWWGLWLTSAFLAQTSIRVTMSANSISTLKNATIFSIISNIVDIPLYIVSLTLVSAIYNMQKAWADNPVSLNPDNP